MKKAIFILLIAAGFVAALFGEVIVYDGFSDDPTTSVPSGWVSTEPANDHGYVASGSLTYPGTASTNNSFGLGNKTADYRKSFAELSPAAGETVYFSALVRMNDGITKNFSSGYFRLYDSANIYGNSILVGVGTSDYTSNLVGFSVNSRNKNWSSTSSVKTPETYTMYNVVHLIVGSYTRGDSGGTGFVNLWVDPAITATPGTPDATMATTLAETESYDVFEINSAGSGSFPGDWQFDELKIGTNWTDVVSATIPGSLPPTADFSADPLSGTKPLSVSFSDLSGGTITNRFWDFGDGTTTNTSLGTLSHSYTNSGTYTVKLVVSGPVGVSTNIQTDLITVTDPIPPAASFSLYPASGDASLLVFFADSSTGTITNRHWNFGDGSTLDTVSTSIQHTYTNAGTFSVSLTAQGPAGSDTDTQDDAVTVTVPTAIIITADGADQYVVESDPPTFQWVSNPGTRIGDDSSGNRTTYVIPFQLPDLDGDVVSAATLKIYLESMASWSSATNVYIDVLGGRVDASSTVTIDDCNATTTVLKDNAQIVNNTVSVPQLQEHELDAAFFRSIYDNDPSAAGKYIFITLRVDNIDPSGANSFLNYSSAEGTIPPQLLFETDRGGPTGIRLDLFTGAF